MHLYQNKNKRSFKIILKLEQDIETHGHKMLRVLNITSRLTKYPLNLFLVKLEQNTNDEDIYNLCKVVIEP